MNPCIATLRAAIRVLFRPSALHYALLGSVVANDTAPSPPLSVA